MQDPSTIFALSSGHGRAGVAVIRISGPAAGSVLDAMAAPRPKPRFAAFRRVRHPVSSEVLDDALVLWLPGPRTETGEDCAELQVHGGGAVLRAVLGALAQVPGCRMAQPGEFARRAFEHGRLDLTAAEGLADLVEAETEAQRRQALAQAGGGLARRYDAWRTRLLEARALMEAAIDFSDEADVAHDAAAQAEARIAALREEIAGHLADAGRGAIVRSGFRVALVGPPNVGKSSLLNALARREVAIVSDEPGTTRDVVEVRLDLGGYVVVLSDTAGLREGAGRVEQEGIRRALNEARGADLVLWLSEATGPRQQLPADLPGPAGAVLEVHSKADLANAAAETTTGLPVSALTGRGLPELTQRIVAEVERRVGTLAEAPPSQERHREGLQACLEALERFAASRDAAAELRAEDVRLAADALGRIVGRIDAEDVLDAIFGRFCIGK